MELENVARDSDPVAQVRELLLQTAAKQQTEDTPQNPPSEQEIEDPESGPEEHIEAEAVSEEPETPDSEEPEAPEEAEGDREVRTFQELLESLELDPEKVYNLPIQLTAGLEPMTLGEVKDTIQEARLTARQQKELQEERQRLSEWRETQEKSYQASVSAANQVLEQLWGGVQQEYDGINWKELRELDPAEYAAKQQEFNARRTQLQGMYQGLQQTVQQQQQQQIAEQQRLYREHLVKGEKYLLDKVPEWTNEETRRKDHEQIQAMALSYGYTPQELAYVADPRLMLMWKELWEYKSQAKNADKALKVAKSLPKMRSPGGRASNSSIQRAKLNKLEEQAKNGTQADKIAYVKELLLRGKP